MGRASKWQDPVSREILDMVRADIKRGGTITGISRKAGVPYSTLATALTRSSYSLGLHTAIKLAALYDATISLERKQPTLW